MIKPNPNIKLKIIYEDNDIIALDKEAGITVHPINFDQNNTLANGLVAEYPEIGKIGEDSLRPGIVHRLDKDTSGLLLVAKNKEAFYALKSQFQERTISKVYLALVYDEVKDNRGSITKSINFSKKDRKKRSALLSEDSKRAWTEYSVKERYRHPEKQAHYTLLEASPKTGRTHQIRIHLSSIGHPIVADKQYSFKRQHPPFDLDRQFLHATYLKFSLLSGKIIELKSDLPAELQAVLDKLKKINSNE